MKRTSLFFRAVHLGGNEEPVPVHKFGYVGVVEHVDGDLLPFFHAQHRARRHAVVTDGADGLAGFQLHDYGRDAQREISRACGSVGLRSSSHRHLPGRLRRRRPWGQSTDSRPYGGHTA